MSLSLSVIHLLFILVLKNWHVSPCKRLLLLQLGIWLRIVSSSQILSHDSKLGCLAELRDAILDPGPLFIKLREDEASNVRLAADFAIPKLYV